tara:strand:+ start:214 stop:771 length:558 start_codon:yes stop_codon:yes gene_type:complete
MQFLPNFLRIIILLFLTFFAISCAQLQNASKKPDDNKSEKVEVLEKQVEKRDINLPPGSTILDEGAGVTLGKLFGFDDRERLNINSVTFEVALDQVDFMPLVSVDTVSGVIITDWYSIDNGNTRMKINIRVVDQEMTDQSLVVSLFTQTLKDNRWVDDGINAEQSQKIKKSILSSARALKIASEL